MGPATDVASVVTKRKCEPRRGGGGGKTGVRKRGIRKST